MRRIAVVNDDTVFLDMMVAVLGEFGWEAKAYRESTTAFAELQAELPDLIILDIRMEKPESGWNLLEVLTLDKRLRHIPVIDCSAAIQDLRAHADWLEQNGIAVLPKPFNVDQLRETVVRELESSR
jgi:CheY-like chemotaxis protein